MSQATTDEDAFQTEQYRTHLDKGTKFILPFSESGAMKDFASSVSNSLIRLLAIDIEQLAAKSQQVVALSSGVDMEMVDLYL